MIASIGLLDVLSLVRGERASMTPACRHSTKMVSCSYGDEMAIPSAYVASLSGIRAQRGPGVCAGQATDKFLADLKEMPIK